MNLHALSKTIFVASAVTTPLPKTEAPIPPTPPCGRRALPFDAINSAASISRGRWDSARTVARGLFIGLIPSTPAIAPTLTQLELNFA